MIKPKIAFVDPGSFVLVHDRFYLNAIIEEVEVDFYYSKLKYDVLGHVDRIDSRVTCHEYLISGSVVSRLRGLFNYFCLLATLLSRRRHYRYIHFNWSLIPRLDSFLLPMLFGGKLIYSLHNVIPHEHKDGSLIYEHRLSARSGKLVLVSDYAYSISEKFNNNCFLLQHGLTLKTNEPSPDKPTECVFAGNVKPYKGIANFINLAELRKGKESFHIYGKWEKSLVGEKNRAEYSCEVVDDFLSDDEFNNIFLSKKAVFVLPYQNISQSGILFNIIAGCLPFIASDRGDFSSFAKKIGYPQILFEPSNLEDIDRALDFCLENHMQIKESILGEQDAYSWKYNKAYLREIYHE